MGQVVVVVRAERTLQSEVEHALSTIEACPIKLLVLNQVRSQGLGAHGYGYGYGMAVMEGRRKSACRQRPHRKRTSEMYLPHVGLVRIPAIGWAAWVLASAPGLVAAQVPDLGSDPQSRTLPRSRQRVVAWRRGLVVINWSRGRQASGSSHAFRCSTPLPIIHALSTTAAATR